MGGFQQDVVENLRSVTQGFGCSDYSGEWYVDWCPAHRFHSGIDLAATLGQRVHTTRPGVVTAVGINYLGPFAVGIRADEGKYLVFGHLDTAAVKVGDRVTAGQAIGTCGTRGNSSGPHVHFAVRLDQATEDVTPHTQDGRILDPTPWLTTQGEDMTPEEHNMLVDNHNRLENVEKILAAADLSSMASRLTNVEKFTGENKDDGHSSIRVQLDRIEAKPGGSSSGPLKLTLTGEAKP